MDAKLLKPRTGPFTYDDFCRMVTDGQKGDLIDGNNHMASPDSVDANRLNVWLIRLVADFCDVHELGEVFASRLALKLDDRNSPEPDVCVLLTEHADRLEHARVRGPADVTFEIVSPDSVDRDYEKKRRLYEKFGVSEYWILDEAMERVTVFRLGPKGYAEVRPRKGVFASKVLPGFWLRAAWVWQKPRPKKAVALAEILAGPPR